MLQDDEIEALLVDLIVLYRYLKDKDVFNQYYKRCAALISDAHGPRRRMRVLLELASGMRPRALAGRLLQEKSKSEALERFIVTKIKVQCGATHTRQIETMLQVRCSHHPYLSCTSRGSL